MKSFTGKNSLHISTELKPHNKTVVSLKKIKPLIKAKSKIYLILVLEKERKATDNKIQSTTSNVSLESQKNNLNDCGIEEIKE